MKERLLRAGRIGLAVAAITSGLTADACAKKPPVPSSPVGITEKAPQFSDTGGDRPLQGQVEKGAGKTIDVEKPPEQGWKTFRSLNYPYQMSYPSSWSAQSIQSQDQNKIDVLKGMVIDGFQVNVTILSEPVNKWVTVDDYVKNYQAQVEQKAIYGEKSVEVRDKNALNGINPNDDLGESGRIYYNLLSTSVAGNKTYFVDAFINRPIDPSNIYAFNPYDGPVFLKLLTVVFMANGQGWQISLTTYTKTGNEEAARKPTIEFQKMIASFRPVK